MESVTLQATRRERLGTKYARRTRQQGKIPAIVYGHGETPEPIALEEHEVELALQHHSRLIHVELEGKKTPLLIKAIQYDHLGTTPIHADLVRVNMDERVTVEVEIELKGTAKGIHEGGVIIQLINTLQVECVVTAIPESFRLNVADLDVNESLTIKDIEVPSGMSVLHDMDDKVVICNVPTVAAEVEEEGESAEDSSQPEIIGKEKPEEGSEGS